MMVDSERRRIRLLFSKKPPERSPEGPPEPVPAGEESEWPEEWDGGVSRHTISFYHAEGAPYLDDDGKLHERPPPEELKDLQRRGLVIPPTIVKKIVGSVVPIREENKPSAAVPVKIPSHRLKKPLGLSIVEEIAYLAFKGIFGEGIRIPIKKEGVADLDVIIRDKEIIIDINEMVGDIPKLSIWRITFAYQGEPLVVFGRGVKGDIKIHPLRMARFIVRAWMEKRRSDKRLRREAAE